MARFNYYQDQLVKVWERRNFTIVAETQEEADKIAKEIAKENYQVYTDDKENVVFSASDMLFETEENITLEENDGKVTMEIWRNNDLVATNKK